MAKDYVKKNCHYQYSTGYIKAISASVMCFAVNKAFITDRVSYIAPCCVRKTLKQYVLMIAVCQAFSFSTVTRSVYKTLFHITIITIHTTQRL